MYDLSRRIVLSFRLEILIFILATATCSLLLFAMRSGKIRGGFVAMWLSVCLLIGSLPFLESFYGGIATFIGMKYAIDMLFMFAILFLMVYVFYLTAKLQRIMDVVEILASRAAIVESHLALMNETKKNQASTISGQLEGGGVDEQANG